MIYAKKFRSVVAQEYSASRWKITITSAVAARWLRQVHAVNGRLTPDRVNDWESPPIESGQQKPSGLKRASVTLISIAEQSPFLSQHPKNTSPCACPLHCPWRASRCRRAGKSRYKSSDLPCCLLPPSANWRMAFKAGSAREPAARIVQKSCYWPTWCRVTA